MRRFRWMLAALAALALAAGVTACGGSDEKDDSGDAAISSADPEATKVIDEWSTALREGDIEAAAALFEVPTVAQNGTPPLKLESEREIIAFNESLPCGAKLVKAEEHAGFTIATFELTERPGPGTCGGGKGETAETAFKVEDGKITEWRRVPGDLEPQAPPAEGPTV